MKKLILLIMIACILFSCGSNGNTENSTAENSTGSVKKADLTPAYDPHRGEGKFTKVEIGATLDVSKATGGKKVYDVKCGACHKLTDEKLVGPGWTGVTSRHAPEWIMNFITNTDAMITKDPKMQAQLEICLVRMPNQSLTDDDARNLLEFMRKNDGIK